MRPNRDACFGGDFARPQADQTVHAPTAPGISVRSRHRTTDAGFRRRAHASHSSRLYPGGRGRVPQATSCRSTSWRQDDVGACRPDGLAGRLTGVEVVAEKHRLEVFQVRADALHPAPDGIAFAVLPSQTVPRPDDLHRQRHRRDLSGSDDGGAKDRMAALDHLIIGFLVACPARAVRATDLAGVQESVPSRAAGISWSRPLRRLRIRASAPRLSKSLATSMKTASKCCGGTGPGRFRIGQPQGISSVPKCARQFGRPLCSASGFRWARNDGDLVKDTERPPCRRRPWSIDGSSRCAGPACWRGIPAGGRDICRAASWGGRNHGIAAQ